MKHGIPLVLTVLLSFAAAAETPEPEPSEKLEVTGGYWEKGERRTYDVLLDNVCIGHEYHTFVKYGKIRDIPVLLYDHVQVIDLRALGRRGRRWIFGKLAVDINGGPVHYSVNEKITEESYEPGKPLISDKETRKTTFDFSGENIKIVSCPDGGCKKAEEKETIPAMNCRIVVDRSLFIHYSAFFQFLEPEKRRLQVRALHPLEDYVFDCGSGDEGEQERTELRNIKKPGQWPVTLGMRIERGEKGGYRCTIEEMNLKLKVGERGVVEEITDEKGFSLKLVDRSMSIDEKEELLSSTE